jgi:hypothetical protein
MNLPGMERGEGHNQRLRGQLLQLGERFIGFDKLVEAETRKAKRAEAERTEILVSRINELEKSVHGEIRSRAETNKQFQADIESFSNTVFEKMQNRVGKRLERIIGELDMMETRCATLERGQQQFRGEVPSKLQVDTAALIKEMNELRTRLDGDVKIWRAREDAVMRKIDLTFKNIMVELEKFENVETDILNKAKADLSKLGTNNQTKQKTIIDEISQIRQSVQLEEENRKFADSEILNAVNSYTGVLQKGLRDIVATR